MDLNAMDLTGPSERALWAPDSSQVLLGGVDRAMLVDVSRAQVIELLPGRIGGAAWNQDGSAIAVSRPFDEKSPDRPGGTFVFDTAGELMWTALVNGFTPNPRWSPDGRNLSVQVDAPPADGERVRYFRLDVFDGGTGEPLYRIDSAIACAGPVWTADGRLLVIGNQAEFRHRLLADPEAGTFQALDSSVVPSPFEANEAFELTFSEIGAIDIERDFYRTDLSTGERTLLARTTLEGGWHGGYHDPLFAGGRIVFAAPHGGHGGCAEGGFPEEPLDLAFQYPPFDD